jgi:hypothetical protein
MNRGSRTAICSAVVLTAVLSTAVLADEKKEDPERARILRQVKVLLEEDDSYKAIEFMSKQGEPLEVAKRYSDLVNDFYWKEKALPHAVTFARAGIQYSLIKSQELIATDIVKANEVRDVARVISYNLASYTWPGWDEKGIVIAEADLLVGLEAAKLNLRLVKELEMGLMSLSAANWAIGAMHMALGQYDDAVNAFESSMEDASLDEAREFELLNAGYLGIAKILKGPMKPEGERELKEAKEKLEKLNTDDSRFLAKQLETALEVFTRE